MDKCFGSQRDLHDYLMWKHLTDMENKSGKCLSPVDNSYKRQTDGKFYYTTRLSTSVFN